MFAPACLQLGAALRRVAGGARPHGCSAEPVAANARPVGRPGLVVTSRPIGGGGESVELRQELERCACGRILGRPCGSDRIPLWALGPIGGADGGCSLPADPGGRAMHVALPAWVDSTAWRGAMQPIPLALDDRGRGSDTPPGVPGGATRGSGGVGAVLRGSSGAVGTRRAEALADGWGARRAGGSRPSSGGPGRGRARWSDRECSVSAPAGS